MILPLVLISEESLEIAINAWDVLSSGVAEIGLEFRINNFFTLYFIIVSGFSVAHMFIYQGSFRYTNILAESATVCTLVQ